MAAALLAAGEARAQRTTGGLSGTVTDDRGAPLPGVRVELRGEGSPVTTFTDAGGEFHFRDLEPGTYTGGANLEGFSAVEYPDLRIRVGLDTEIEISLSPDMGEEITVSGDAPIIDEPRTGVTDPSLDRIPSGQDPWAILLQNPGVIMDRIDSDGNVAGPRAGGAGPTHLVLAGDRILWVDIGDLADATGDDDVSREDFDAWRRNRDAGGADAADQADAGDDQAGAVDAIDYSAWMQSFYISDARRLGPGGRADATGDAATGDPPDGIFVFGVDLADLPPVPEDLGLPDFSLDLDGDGHPDVPFLSYGGLNPVTPGVEYGAWKIESGAGGGGRLSPDPDGPRPDLDKWGLDDRWSFNMGVRQEPDGERPPPDRSNYRLDDGPDGWFGGDGSHDVKFGGVGRSAPPPEDFDPLPGGPIVRDKLWIWGAYGSVAPRLTHNAFTSDGVQDVSLEDGLPPASRDRDGPTGVWTVEDTHVFASDFYLTGIYTVVDGGFLAAENPGEVGDPRWSVGRLVGPEPGADDDPAEAPFFFGGVNMGPGYDGGVLGAGGFLAGQLQGVDGDAPGEAPGPGGFRLGFDYQVDRVRVTPVIRVDGMMTECPGFPGTVAGFVPGQDRGGYGPLERVPPSEDDCEIVARYDFGAALGGRFSLARPWYLLAPDPVEDERDPDPDDDADDRLANAPNRPILQFGGPERPGEGYWLGPDGQRMELEDFNADFLEGTDRFPDGQYYGGELKLRTGGDPAPADGQEGPGGALRELSDGRPLLLLESLGGSTGEVVRAHLIADGSAPVEIDGFAVLEPLRTTEGMRQELARRLEWAAGRATATIEAYCLEKDRLPLPQGGLFRLAPPETQAAYAHVGAVLAAAARVRDAGRLHPDSDPRSYFHSIRQWAVWTREKDYDRDGFLDAFVEHTRRTFADAGQPWSDEIAEAVRQHGRGRWEDIREVLVEADSPGR